MVFLGGGGVGCGYFGFGSQDIVHQQDMMLNTIPKGKVRRNVLTVHFENYVIIEIMHLRFIVKGLLEILLLLLFFSKEDL